MYNGGSVCYITGRACTLGEARDKNRTALARAAEKPCQQRTWGIDVDGDLIGRIALRRRAPVMASLSYILREDTWGNGYATEAAKRVVQFAFTTVDWDRLEATHHPANPASGRVLAKVGFTRTGTSDRHIEDGTAVPRRHAGVGWSPLDITITFVDINKPVTVQARPRATPSTWSI
ncbi:GNAT family N-acetyltransferase [Streptomyces sp. NPDC021212]|uniref:GNAT family N-acetyltransferase n=1 Tax=Streptomyces sp. NPDC021212 TaxID=3365118 RepID=UPI00378EBE83